MATPVKSCSENILVTGASGYIGRHLQKRMPFIAVDKDQAIQSLESFDPQASVVKNVKTVIHLADRRLQDIHAGNIKINIQMHRDFFAKLTELPGLEQVIFASSCSVYGFSEEFITEASATNPTSHYAESKLEVEQLLQKMGLPGKVCRFGTAYGWSDHMREDLFINQLALSAAQGLPIEIYSPDAWRPYIHCRDFAASLESSMHQSWQGPRNIVTQNLTKSEIVQLKILKESALNFKMSQIGDPRNYRVKIIEGQSTRACDVAEGLQEMMDMYARKK